MKLGWLALGFFYFGAAGPAQAAPTEMRAIVLAGTKLPARVSGQLESVQAKLGALIPAPGFPKVVESKLVPGLKPGFEVILLGLCPTLGVEGGLTNLVEQAAKDAVSGSYSRPVKVEGPPACPQLKISRPDEPEGQQPWAAYEKSPDSPDAQVALGHYLVSVGDLDGGEYLGLRALLKSPQHPGAKGLLEKIGVLRTD